ncbi:MAG: glycosyltransferase [Melioribacteraceae bacterium]|nr:glycosyltransferase [Melioribacteraceae bacterium]
MDSFPLSELILILYTFSLTILLIFSSNGFIMLYYNNKFKRKFFTETSIDKSKIVTIQLPLFNEMNVAERLINAVCKIDYPKSSLEIQVLDDSTDETSKIVSELVKLRKSEGYNIKHIQRDKRTGYKAGALKDGLQKANGEFIAIFDADFIPQANFLQKTLPRFHSKNIGMVQTRWEHLNETSSLLTKVQAFALNGHFVIEQEVRNKSGFFINFNGTGGIWRKECIVDAGNWQADTLTEDLDLSFRAQIKGWRFIYLKDVTTPAELPSEISSLKTQQFRWTKGSIETAKKLLPTIWSSKLNLRIKLYSTFHLTNNFIFPFVLLIGLLNVPLLFIKNGGEFNSIINFMSLFILAFISTFFLYILAQKGIHKNWIKRGLIFPVFISGTMGMAINNSRAVLEGLLNKKSEFIRTPKFSSNKDIVNQKKYLTTPKISFQLLLEILFTIYSLAGVIIAIYFIEITALPFHLMFFIGFFSVSALSLKQVLIKNC